MRYYVDTCIWMDFLEDRKDPQKDLSKIAFQFLRKLQEQKKTIIISTPLMAELQEWCDPAVINGLFLPFANAIKIQPRQEQAIEARKLAKTLKIPFTDALHAILARDAAAIVVTRDKHFRCLEHICIAKKPEELLQSELL
ncbi:MAG: PIN domain-containing protein [Nanoarchaeota archaeon]